MREFFVPFFYLASILFRVDTVLPPNADFKCKESFFVFSKTLLAEAFYRGKMETKLKSYAEDGDTSDFQREPGAAFLSQNRHSKQDLP